MIKIELVINIHELLIEKFGGIHGIRDLKATQSEKYDFVMKIANGQFSFAQIKDWITEKAVQT